MADNCEMCAHFVSDEEFGDYCSVNLDEDEMEKRRILCSSTSCISRFIISTCSIIS